MKETVCPRYTETKCPRIIETTAKDCVAADTCGPGEVCFTCPDAFGILICNSNGIQDDSWDIRLNGTYVANYNIGNETRALLILPLSAMGKTLSGHTGRGCTLFTIVYSDLLDSLSGLIIMAMTIVFENGSGNAGTIEFACVTQDATDAVLGTTVNSTTYSGSGLGYTLTRSLRKL